MDWYYARNGRQSGPVSENELDSLVRSGEIALETLVWRRGMDAWLPYASARGAATAPDVPPRLDDATCCECNRSFSRNDLLRIENHFVCAECKPAFLQRMREGVAPAGGTAWRSGNLLVVRRNASLPDRCVKCNAPAHGRRLTRKLSWHTPWIYLIIFVGVLFYVIAAVILRKRARVEIGICEAHWAARRRDVLIGWASFLVAILLGWCGAHFGNGWLYGSALTIFLGGLIYAAFRTPVVSAKKIDADFVWLKGASRAYTAELPEFRGPR